jgi:ribosomal protein S18 acetylase RimI-like enzyme
MPDGATMGPMTVEDPLLAWAAQDDRPGTRVWHHGDATAVSFPALAHRDRITVTGSPDDVVELLREALPVVGPTYRPMGDEALITAVVAAMPELELAKRYAFMHTTEPPDGRAGPAWLDRTDEVERLLGAAFPDSFARPGGAGVRRWAGITEDGDLVATAAEAWSAREVGFMAGVATRSDRRGRGLGRAICAFVTSELLTEHPRVGLFADYWNDAAIATYRGLGFKLRPLANAQPTPETAKS